MCEHCADDLEEKLVRLEEKTAALDDEFVALLKVLEHAEDLSTVHGAARSALDVLAA